MEVVKVHVSSVRCPEEDHDQVGQISENRISEDLEFISSNVNVKSAKDKVINRIARLQSYVRWYGMDDEQLAMLLSFVLKGNLDEASAVKLIKLMLPRQRVPEIYVIKIFGTFALRRTYRVFVALLKWIILCYENLESTAQIQRLYGVIFHFLEFDTLRPYICHILYYLTRRNHVKPFRIRKLLDLQSRVGQEPHLIGLLAVYKDYFPNLVLITIPKSKKALFKCPDIVWGNAMQAVIKRWATSQDNDSPSLYKQPLQLLASIKRRKIDYDVPKSTATDVNEKLVTIDDIMTFQSLAENIDRLSLPNQLASVLDNRLLQHWIVCNPQRIAISRIGHWLHHCVMDALYWNNKTLERARLFGELLGKVVQLSEFVKELLPVFETFLASYLKCWNGDEFQNEVFRLIPFAKPDSYENLHGRFLKPLYRLYCISSALWKAKLLSAYTELLRNWAMHDWAGHLWRRTNVQDEVDMDELGGMFEGLSFKVDYLKSMQEFIVHVDRICVIGLAAEGDHPVLQHAILSFFELVAVLPINYNIPTIIIPSSAIIHHAFFSFSGMPITRICGIISLYKIAFEDNEHDREQIWMTSYSPEYVNHFNSFVMDMCNCIWRNRALNRVDKNAVAFDTEEALMQKITSICEGKNLNVSYLFSMTHSCALGSYSTRFMKKLEQGSDAARSISEPVTSQSLKANMQLGGLSIPYMDYRIQYLDYLQEQGYGGMVDFLYSSMTSLMARRKPEEPL